MQFGQALSINFLHATVLSMHIYNLILKKMIAAT